jgi:hypothetical protein
MASSFMRTNRDSQKFQESSSMKQSFKSFSLLDTDEQVYHFGGSGKTIVEKFRSDTNKSEQLNLKISKNYMQIVYHRVYNSDKCLIIGG